MEIDNIFTTLCYNEGENKMINLNVVRVPSLYGKKMSDLRLCHFKVVQEILDNDEVQIEKTHFSDKNVFYCTIENEQLKFIYGNLYSLCMCYPGNILKCARLNQSETDYPNLKVYRVQLVKTELYETEK